MSSQNSVRQKLSKLQPAVQNINLESLLRIEVVFFNGHTTAGGLGLALGQGGVAEQASRLQQLQASRHQ